MKVNKGGRFNPAMSKGRDNFFVPKNSKPKPTTSNSGDNFFVKKNDPDSGQKSNQDRGKLSRGNSGKPFVRRKQQREGEKDEGVKKTFDKKKYRLQKYSNKFKLEQWGEKRKNAVMRDYRRQVKGDEPGKVNVQKLYEEYAEDIEAQEDGSDREKGRNFRSSREDEDKQRQMVESENENNANANTSRSAKKSKISPDKAKKLPFKKARAEFQRKKEEKDLKKVEAIRRKTEREAALKEYKEKKIKKFKKLNQKTKKGQPIMKNRIEMLLEQIQASKASEN